MEIEDEHDERVNPERIPPFHPSFCWGVNHKSLYFLITPLCQAVPLIPSGNSLFFYKSIYKLEIKKTILFHDFLDKSEMSLLN